MQQYTNPRFIYHGEHALDALKTLDGKKAFVCIGGGSLKRSGFYDIIEGNLKEAGFEIELFEGIESDPSVETVNAGAAAMAAFEPDWIVAIGGGSPIDAAKAMWVKYENPDISFEQMTTPFGLPKMRTKARFCAISTTSGTGTEVTAFAVITDYEKGIKYPMADFEITPDVAIVDPLLVSRLPAGLVAFTGMDALTHAIESYVSTAHSPYTDAMALHAIRMIQANLVQSYAGDQKARAAMHDAQNLAGQAFSSGLLGIVHSMAHKTGAAFEAGHIIHGCANAMYLPKVIRFNAGFGETADRFADIADVLGFGGPTRDDKVAHLIEWVRWLNDQMNIPQAIQSYGPKGKRVEAGQGIVPEGEFKEKLPAIAANALADACTASNPRPVDQRQMEAILTACYYDTPIRF
ncbi:MAG: iron-containing alcohol dehydrogenase [Denitrobacterium sp.]|jgi:alcohol dehydrogenase class IV|nr:iron-containing alcohol dehydrogenase [Denitrobacterium sp.]